MSKAYADILTRRYTLEFVRDTFPELEPLRTRAQKRWDDAFKKAEDNVESVLAGSVGQEWPKVREKAVADVIELRDKRFRDKMTSQGAKRFLEGVERASQGAIPSPAREILLASHPDYQASPEREAIDGFTTTFFTRGNAKAGGLDMALKIPMSWKPMDKAGATTVQAWISEGGYGADRLLLSVFKLQSAPTAAERESFLSDSQLKDFLKLDGTILEFSQGSLEGVPVAKIRNTPSIEVRGARLETQATNYCLIHEDKLIILTLVTAPRPGNKAADGTRGESMSRLLKCVLHSVVLHATPK